MPNIIDVSSEHFKGTRNKNPSTSYERLKGKIENITVLEKIISILMDESKANNWGLTHYFLEKALESLPEANVRVSA